LPIDVPDGYVLADWTADGGWLLSRRDRDRDLPTFVHFDLETGATTPLFDGERLRTGRMSADRRWIAVTRTFEDDPAANGVFLVRTDPSVPPRKLDLVGGYRWRDDGRLLVVPQEPGAPSMVLWQVDAATGEARRLTDPASTPFRIAAGEWSVSPDGAHVAFRSADDDAIWVLSLGE
jgi:hypothetical protein